MSSPGTTQAMAHFATRIAQRPEKSRQPLGKTVSAMAGLGINVLRHPVHDAGAAPPGQTSAARMASSGGSVITTTVSPRRAVRASRASAPSEKAAKSSARPARFFCGFPARAAHPQDAHAMAQFLASGVSSPTAMAGDDGHAFAGRSQGLGEVGEQLRRGRLVGPVETIDKNQCHYYF